MLSFPRAQESVDHLLDIDLAQVESKALYIYATRFLAAEH